MTRMISNKLIRSHLQTVNNDAKSLTKDQLKVIFDDILDEVSIHEKYDESIVCPDCVDQFLDAIMHIPIKQLTSEPLVSHRLFSFICDILIDILRKWKPTSLCLNIQETNIFEKIIQLFSMIIDQDGTMNKLLINDELLEEIKLRMEDILNNKQNLNNDPNINNLGIFATKILHNTTFLDDAKNASLLMNFIINCISSLDYINAVKQLQSVPVLLNQADKFLLYTSFEYFPKYCPSDTKKSIINEFCMIMLERYEYMLDRLLSFKLNTQPIIRSLEYILNIIYKLLDTQVPDVFRQHGKIIDHLCTILDNTNLINCLQLSDDAINNHLNIPNFTTLILSAIKTFHAASSNPDLLPIIKDKQKTEMFLKFSKINNKEIQIYANNIMINTMSDHEIECLDNAQEITSMYINKLKQTINDPNEVRILLSGLKGVGEILVQHDQMKDEFIKQDGLPLLIKYACQVNDQSIEIQRESLATLWATTFNANAATTLKQDKVFMAHVKSLLNSNDPELKKSADGIIWKVEKEQEFKQKLIHPPTSSTNGDDEEMTPKTAYDIMISYSWADQELCSKIHDGLVAKNFRVWLDKNEMHGSTIEAMANAVESSEVILMCMSETYKKSTNCKSEAEYAFNRKRRIIPIIMREKYCPDGWLGFIAGSRMYIDFSAVDVQTGLEKLISEIELNRTKPKARPLPEKVPDKDLVLSQGDDNTHPIQLDEPKPLITSD
ncbi:unnamed protein product, partial [Didymodactylos carnosus]